ncbi:hypothetical protein FOZ62_010844, partial [Perkinsus olseni]
FFVPDLDEEQEGTDFFSIVRPFGEDVVVLEVPAGSANPSQTSAGDASRRTVDQDRRGMDIDEPIIDAWMTILWRRMGGRLVPPQPMYMSQGYGGQLGSFNRAPGHGLLLQPINLATEHHYAGTARVEGTIYYMDSLSRGVNSIPAIAKHYLRTLYGPNKPVIFMGIQQQSTGSNTCALHVLARLTQFALGPSGSDPELVVFDESRMRLYVFEQLDSDTVNLFPAAVGDLPDLRRSDHSQFRT